MKRKTEKEAQKEKLAKDQEEDVEDHKASAGPGRQPQTRWS